MAKFKWVADRTKRVMTKNRVLVHILTSSFKVQISSFETPNPGMKGLVILALLCSVLELRLLI